MKVYTSQGGTVLAGDLAPGEAFRFAGNGIYLYLRTMQALGEPGAAVRLEDGYTTRLDPDVPVRRADVSVVENYEP